MLRGHLPARFGREVLFLHGGVAKAGPRRDGRPVPGRRRRRSPPLFVLSLKAGGTGLTLTAANHVVHVDRWWNPAVEDQATDRAFRIGQRRDVQVRKFVCAGTVEEKIAAMISDKRGLAAKIVGTGEQWLTELSTGSCASCSRSRPGRWSSERAGAVRRDVRPDRDPGRGRAQGAQHPRRDRRVVVVRRFLDVLESFAIGGRLTRGRSYAREGQVLSLEVAPGRGARPRCRARGRSRTR